MKIAFLTDGIPPYIIGGMQKHSLELAKELVLNGMDVDLFHFVQKNEKIPSSKEVNKLIFKENLSFNKVFCTNFPSSINFPGHYIWNSYKYSKWVFKLIKNDIEKYDFIYAKGFSAWKLLRIKRSQNLNINIGVKFHGYEMFQHPASLRTRLEYLLLKPFVIWINRNADYVFSYGGKITTIIKSIGVPENKIIEIPSGIKSNWIRSKDEISLVTKHKLLFIGRNERRKAYLEICKAIVKIKNISLEFHLIGPFLENEKIHSNNHKIIYHGLIKDNLIKRNIIDQCDILLCPSFSEGMPNVIIESMSRGLSIIASDVGAVSELVNYKNGVLLASNTSDDILNAIVKLLNLRRKDFLKMRFNSIDKVEKNFLWEKIIQLTLNKINILYRK